MPEPESNQADRVLVSGAGGFAGGHLCRHLKGQGRQVLGIGLEAAQSDSPCRLILCDLLDFERLCSVVENYRPSFVYHLAGLVSPAQSRAKPRDYYLVNVQGTVNLLEAVRLYCPQARVLFTSSSEVYDSLEEDITEESALNPANPYASSKLLAEEVCREYWVSYGIPIVLARPFNHSGPGQGSDFVIPEFCRQVAQLELEDSAAAGPLRLQVGNLAPIRDFLDVRDVVRAYAGLAERGANGEVYNVCSGLGVTIRQVLEALLRLARVTISAEVDPEKYRPLLKPRMVGSDRKLRSLLDWMPQYSLEQTLADTLDSWRAALRLTG